MGNNAAFTSFEASVIACHNKGVLDKELLDAAGKGDLNSPEGLEKQVTRLMFKGTTSEIVTGSGDPLVRHGSRAAQLFAPEPNRPVSSVAVVPLTRMRSPVLTARL